MRLLRFYARATLLALGACSGLPTAGPTTSQVIEQAAKQESTSFRLVEVSPVVVAAAMTAPGDEMPPYFHGKPPTPTVGVGDTLSVTIWQTGTLGLSAAPTGAGTNPLLGNNANGGGFLEQINVPEQVVSTDGGVTVPFAGRVRAAGRTPLQIQQTIAQGLSEHLLAPEVVVTVPKSVSDLATVAGETLGGVRVPISPGGERLLDVIATAGGAKAPLYETEVRLTRNGRTGSVSMNRLVLDPAENIFVWPGDSITVIRAPKTFSVFGATLNNNQLPFNAARLNLAQAIARAGGLQDARADPAGVFLFRFESPGVVAAEGIPPGVSTLTGIPILYHLDLQKVGSYFLASRFPMKDDDIIYVAGAKLNDLQKFFALIGTVTLPVLSGAVLAK